MPIPPRPALLALSASVLVGLALLVGGCDSAEGERPDLVVSAFLGAEEALPPVRLSRTVPLLEPYDPAAAAVAGARVTVTLLDAGGADEAVYAYAPGPAGVYLPESDAAVLERRTYRLDVVGPDGERLTAQTTVPPDFDVVRGPDPVVPYGLGQGPAVQITASSTPERQAAFVGSTQALAPDEFERVTVDGETRYRSRNLPGRFRPVPIVRRFLDCVEEPAGTLLCEDDPGDENVRVGTSPVINEAGYTRLGDGSLLVQIPFLAFGYLGPQSLTLVSLDAAFQDFVQTRSVQSGGSTLSPGEIPNVTTNVEGGLGVFGSFARETVETTLVEPEGLPGL
ncbi:DUF4249 family protein [Rubrivirga sp. S365]|uniref:DUF4249 family protein n=1 Tax=Rubrivirga litoralis TaxID=3075598 RepID=A0ABU3BSL1_9BACT|nr:MULTISPECIES: DUF4249 family protein [unclassified Rubrivirga]MDT0632272.1 DUF4249 family protein [Rubrivirga sp. F394]MDT7856343.1 DUF4249 family protein [Rubrivirga sp. S365]